ncbi:zinc finger B-box domain-containing protein 1-like [Ruditapes philippinarum]|uniref:zinc finger B-box domain-containing protein 1-like n=1 Tax=Ruditapes philippinarum TaxID=129788 RepID=UPI00295B5579|nr:zinc finger B-box domain-containing protein 1-like [Ruditapes philippinarum]
MNTSTGPLFNLSTKKEDVSTRLKTQNLKRAKHETKKLEEEGRKMEERLIELKMAMNREKEERERQGGGFWKKGQTGTLNNYAEEVLSKKKNKSASSKGKVKILRDKPLELPERSNQPGTMAYIAQKGAHTPRDKPKGPKCGQCEERTAAVSCVQCSEDYCAGCFAAFHLKGNLKKHRSVPLTATPRQCFASPRVSQSYSHSYDFDHGDGDGATELYVPESARKKDRNSPEGASGNYENSLLQGSYNEAEQAASFQDALIAWRTGGKPADHNSNSGGSRPSTDRSSKRGGVPYSPVQTPTVNVDTSTGTADSSQEVEIKFNTASMTYAERLMLKKHRRTDVDRIFTPRENGDVNASPTPRRTPRERPPSYKPQRELSNISLKIVDFSDGDFDAEERVDFGSLLEVVRMVDGEPVHHKDPDTISIVEVQDSIVDKSIEQAVAYKVQEDGEEEAWSSEARGQESGKLNFEVKPPSSGKASRRKSGRKSARSSIDATTKETQSVESARLKSSRTDRNDAESRLKSSRTDRNDAESRLKSSRTDRNDAESRLKSSRTDRNDTESRLKSSRTERNDNEARLKSSRTDRNDSDTVSSKDSHILGSRLKDIENEVKKEDFYASSGRKEKSRLLKEKSSLSQKEKSIYRENSELAREETIVFKDRPDSGQSRSSNTKPRPQTGNKAKNRQGTQSRTTSRQGSRPGSRTTSRIGSSRAASRKENPGLLTKSPSDALKEIARMTPSQDTYKGIDSFFMVGVQPSQQEERTLTPTKHKNKEEKIKVSYQLYNMAPRSWKPDFSLTDTVDVDDVAKDEAEDDRAHSVMAYHAYSEQLVSDITERMISRFGELPLDDDSLSDQSSGGAYRSLGEEYKTFTPRSHGSSVQNSPSMSGRATPIQSTRSQIRDSSQTPRKPPVQPPSQTPRQSARSRAQTPRLTKSRAEVKTPRRSKTFHGEIERPESRAIVMEGTDLSIFDHVGEKDNRDQEDEDALGQLEWELASQSGRVTAEGKISRMEMPEDMSDDSINSSLESFRSMSRLGQDQGYDINSRLRKDELEDEDTITDDENDVRNLM